MRQSDARRRQERFMVVIVRLSVARFDRERAADLAHTMVCVISVMIPEISFVVTGEPSDR